MFLLPWQPENIGLLAYKEASVRRINKKKGVYCIWHMIHLGIKKTAAHLEWREKTAGFNGDFVAHSGGLFNYALVTHILGLFLSFA